MRRLDRGKNRFIIYRGALDTGVVVGRRLYILSSLKTLNDRVERYSIAGLY